MKNNNFTVPEEVVNNWSKIKMKYTDSVLLLCLGEYYYSLHDDALDIADLPDDSTEFDRQCNVVRILKQYTLDHIMPALVRRHYKVTLADII